MHSVTLAQIVNRPDLLPTPTVIDLGNNKTVDEWETWTEEQRTKHGNGNGHGASLSIEAQTLVHGKDWGRFAQAIARWETVNGTAPAPTEPYGDDGKHRLSARFAEWMMGLPAGWVTDCNITRNEQLKACGNGVVPQQATLALKLLGAHNVIQDN